jgi:hypothetical protein
VNRNIFGSVQVAFLMHTFPNQHSAAAMRCSWAGYDPWPRSLKLESSEKQGMMK